MYGYGSNSYYYEPHLGGCRDSGGWGDNGSSSDGLFYFSEKWYSTYGYYLKYFGSLSLNTDYHSYYSFMLFAVFGNDHLAYVGPGDGSPLSSRCGLFAFGAHDYDAQDCVSSRTDHSLRT